MVRVIKRDAAKAEKDEGHQSQSGPELSKRNEGAKSQEIIKTHQEEGQNGFEESQDTASAVEMIQLKLQQLDVLDSNSQIDELQSLSDSEDQNKQTCTLHGTQNQVEGTDDKIKLT